MAARPAVAPLFPAQPQLHPKKKQKKDLRLKELVLTRLSYYDLLGPVKTNTNPILGLLIIRDDAKLITNSFNV
jgi:hypothetical protein